MQGNSGDTRKVVQAGQVQGISSAPSEVVSMRVVAQTQVSPSRPGEGEGELA